MMIFSERALQVQKPMMVNRQMCRDTFFYLSGAFHLGLAGEQLWTKAITASSAEMASSITCVHPSSIMPV